MALKAKITDSDFITDSDVSVRHTTSARHTAYIMKYARLVGAVRKMIAEYDDNYEIAKVSSGSSYEDPETMKNLREMVSASFVENLPGAPEARGQAPTAFSEIDVNEIFLNEIFLNEIFSNLSVNEIRVLLCLAKLFAYSCHLDVVGDVIVVRGVADRLVSFAVRVDVLRQLGLIKIWPDANSGESQITITSKGRQVLVHAVMRDFIREKDQNT